MFEQFIISIQIILIDIVMAADNAIIIGMIASSFAQNNRKRIIAWGIAAAFAFRIIFAFGAVYILEFPFIKILEPPPIVSCKLPSVVKSLFILYTSVECPSTLKL